MKLLRFLGMFLFTIALCANFSSCSDDDDEISNKNKELDATLYGEWLEDSDNQYIFDYYNFYSDGTGIHGSYEVDIDWVNEDEDFTWYTVNDEYVYINGYKHKYSCDGSSLMMEVKPGRTKYYYSK